ncbi:fluoride efflux transporter CrcB [Marinobacter xestospongiae]|uniref:Fluoride-specific ion channel FluC n=1 Tax=Marinobacter xestospongiae TaxID=994319 RepID=A0ABU3VWV5_9GAMM|nr:fluoride efflux transporter CrcB [Marinobacter xestospongiae]MDV2078676.1 fluoride efflux transporter CrcB [Marinobacter xestospongiae]
MWLSCLAVSLGAVIGANLRWLLGLWLNSSYHAIPVGTLVANLAGGWLIGVLISYFSHDNALAPEWRLFAITGLCGALTTFSTFSLEMFAAIQDGKWLMAVAGSLAHLLGSLLMVVLGVYSAGLLRA